MGAFIAAQVVQPGDAYCDAHGDGGTQTKFHSAI